MSVLSREEVLVLNRVWQVIGTCTIRDAFTALNSTETGQHLAAWAMQIEYAQNENGSWDMSQPTVQQPIPFEEWIKLPVRDIDLFVCTPKLKIRVPSVIVVTKYDKIPKKSKKLNAKNLSERDGHRCQYTGVKLTKKTFSKDHIIPRSRGGKDDWTNVVACHIDVNLKKRDRTPDEAGLKLLKQPKAPPLLPVSCTITEIRHRDWKWFLKND